ncbi:MAG: DUF2933 domain-containing protein [Candidatus Acidiferrales bacterium]
MTPRVRNLLVFLGFAFIAGYFLLGEHRIHALSFWPLLFILACPFMHFFMHGGHDSMSDHAGHTNS